MIYLGLPYGSNFGWGVLGKEIILAMSRLTGVCVLAPDRADQRLVDEFELYQFRRLLAAASEPIQGPVIQAVLGRKLQPFVPRLADPAALAYAVFEEDRLPMEAIAQARNCYRRIAVPSAYCAEVLSRHGLSGAAVLPHGVDTGFFRPRAEPRSFLRDAFVVYSGGKFELRKGQDIVIRAYKVLQDRHKDVVLVNSWHNNWPKMRDTMAASRLMRYFPPKDRKYVAWVNALLGAQGIDMERVVTIGPRDHRLLPDLYHATDLGLFPNRAEGGNNMVLMEYMACGKPVLASFNTGHREVLRRQNAVLIEQHRPLEYQLDGEHVATWSNPSLEETVEKLEWCYRNRGQLQALGQQAAKDMQDFSWRRLARNLLGLVQ